jgi:hypothetical protein
MRYFHTSICFIFLLFVAAVALAQNGAYSSYYAYTVNYNPDGSANVTPTAEVTGIDDVSDWVEGGYRPLCTVRPKIQLIHDGDWVGGTRVALGHAVDQVRTGQALQVPADGSTVYMQFSVEVDANCSSVPHPNYYRYPQVSSLYNWSQIDPTLWLLAGFSLTQTAPPYYLQYCPSAITCPVAYGVASVLNFVDFADFSNITIRTALSTYAITTVNGDGSVTFTLSCPNGNQNATCGTPTATGWEPTLWLEVVQLYTQPGGCWPLGLAQYRNGPPAPYLCH